MSNIVISKGTPVPSLVNINHTVYVEESQLCFHQYRDSFSITLLDNALTPGQFCPQFNFVSKIGDAQLCLQHVEQVLGTVTPSTLRQYASGLSFVGDRRGNLSLDITEDVSVSLCNRSSIRTYSPFALARLKPLTSIPSQWNLMHVKKALANGQIEHLKCNAKYTDDYFADAESNFGEGTRLALPFLESLISSPSGWQTSLNKETRHVSVCRHHFEDNSFVLKLTPDIASEAISF
ncbi:MAG: hypothetical protein Q7S87_01200 [Agitococcus sp.]|nr:hypothetical protein [Agitococcus sp.]MDO9179142.1 hypothetical protein [Agitococcus sp.]